MSRPFFALGLVLALGPLAPGEPPPGGTKKPGPDLDQVRREAALAAAQMERQFREFKQSLLLLRQRLDRGEGEEDRERAAGLNKALKESDEKGVEAKLDSLARALAEKDFTLETLDKVLAQTGELTGDLRTLLATLLSDGRDERRREQLDAAKRLIKAVEALLARHRDLETALAGTAPRAELLRLAAGLAEAVGKLTTPRVRGARAAAPVSVLVERVAAQQKLVGEHLSRDDRKAAVEAQAAAGRHLRHTLKLLADARGALQEEDDQRLRAAVGERCQKILDMQTSVRVGTATLARAVAARPGKRPALDDLRRMQQLADKTAESRAEFEKVLEILKNAEEPFASPEALKKLREALGDAERLLNRGEAGEATQREQRSAGEGLRALLAAAGKGLADGAALSPELTEGQERLGEALGDALPWLQDSLQILRRAEGGLAGGVEEEDLVTLSAWLEQARLLLVKAAHRARGPQAECRRALDRLRAGQASDQLAAAERRLFRPLETVLKQDLVHCNDALAGLGRALDDPAVPPARRLELARERVAGARLQLESLSAGVERIDRTLTVSGEARLVRPLREMEAVLRKQQDVLKRQRDILIENLLKGD